MLKEVESLRKATDDPARPYVVVLGGSKVSDKLGVIANLLTKADRLLIGGGMVFTFLAAKGYSVGNVAARGGPDRDRQGLPRAGRGGRRGDRAADRHRRGRRVRRPTPRRRSSPADAIPDGKIGLDIGPESSALFARKIVDAKTVVWNGPTGVFEFEAFSGGTRAVAQALVDAGANGGFTIVGGGDSAAAVRTLGFDEAGFGHISTGGGASLEFLEGKTLPGIAVLED